MRCVCLTEIYCWRKVIVVRYLTFWCYGFILGVWRSIHNQIPLSYRWLCTKGGGDYGFRLLNLATTTADGPAAAAESLGGGWSSIAVVCSYQWHDLVSDSLRIAAKDHAALVTDSLDTSHDDCIEEDFRSVYLLPLPVIRNDSNQCRRKRTLPETNN